MCGNLWNNFFLVCSLWSSHCIDVLRCPCGVGTINTLSFYHLQRVQILHPLVQPFLSWDSLISQTSQFFSIAFGRNSTGFSPVLKSEALQGVEPLCNGRWGGEGRSSRSEWTEVWCETGLSVHGAIPDRVIPCSVYQRLKYCPDIRSYLKTRSWWYFDFNLAVKNCSYWPRIITASWGV